MLLSCPCRIVIDFSGRIRAISAAVNLKVLLVGKAGGRGVSVSPNTLALFFAYQNAVRLFSANISINSCFARSGSVKCLAHSSSVRCAVSLMMYRFGSGLMPNGQCRDASVLRRFDHSGTCRSKSVLRFGFAFVPSIQISRSLQ